MMQESEYPTTEKATTRSNRSHWCIYAVLLSVVIAGIVGLTLSLTSFTCYDKHESSVDQTPGLRGSTANGTVPVANNDAVVEDPIADTDNDGNNPAPVDEGTNNGSNNDEGADPMANIEGTNPVLSSGSNSTVLVDYTKTSWPELVGRPGEEARTIIMQENPNMTFVQLVPVGSFVTADWREDRVRIYVEEDEEKTVASIPNMG
jgi:hypothetical protein